MCKPYGCRNMFTVLGSISPTARAALLQVWVVPEMRADGLIYWRADSDSQLTKVRR